MTRQLKTRKLPTATGVVAGQTATIAVPLGVKYHTIYIQYKTNANQTTIEADLSRVRLMVNGKVQRELSAKHILRLINIPNGVAFVAGFLPIFFSEPWARLAADEKALGLGTMGLQSVAIEIDVASGASSPVIEAYAEIEEVNEPPSFITKWIRVNEQFSASGTFRISNKIPKNLGMLKRLHIVSATDTASANVSAVKENADGNIVADVSKTLNDVQLAARGITPQNMGGTNSNTVFLLAHDIDEHVAHSLPLSPITTHELELTVGAAAVYDLIAEVVGPIQ